MKTPEKQRKKGKTVILWKRVFGAVFILILLLWAIGFGAMQAYEAARSYLFGTTTASIHASEKPVRDVPKLALVQQALDKPMYILAVGMDASSPAQADAVFLIAANGEQKTIDIIGLPSNTKIENRDRTAAEPLNRIYETGGIELLRAVTEDLFRISIPYYIAVDAHAFESVVDVTGDRDFYVELPMHYTNGLTGRVEIDIPQGYRTLSPSEAYGYMRYIGNEGDSFSRLRRQERLLKAIVTHESERLLPIKMWDISRFWGGFETNISTADAVEAAVTFRDMNASGISYYILPGVDETIDGRRYWNPDPSEAQRLVGITMEKESQ